MGLDSWAGSIDLTTPAGRLLQGLVSAFPTDRSVEITVFGSAPLQILIDSRLNSADVDVFSDSEDLKDFVRRNGFGPESAAYYIQVGTELNFRASPRWRDRAHVKVIGNCTLRFPHPIDILIAKLSRLEEKDIEAFRSVIEKTGHPTEEELIRELQLAVDLFRPGFDEEQSGDLAENCRRLWQILYRRRIDPRVEIIMPALQKRREGYGESDRDYQQELRDALRDYQA